MKKKLLVFIAGSSIQFMSCTTPSSNKAVDNNPSQMERNLFAANSIDKAVETGDVSRLGDYITADAVDHSDVHGDVKGLDKIKNGLSQVHKMASGDMKLTIKKEVADSEFVFQWIVLTGTSTSGDMGVPLGQKFEMNTIGVSKFKDGKATDYWEFVQPAEMLKMMAPAKAPPRK